MVAVGPIISLNFFGGVSFYFSLLDRLRRHARMFTCKPDPLLQVNPAVVADDRLFITQFFFNDFALILDFRHGNFSSGV
jgi:hypothetical protein